MTLGMELTESRSFQEHSRGPESCPLVQLSCCSSSAKVTMSVEGAELSYYFLYSMVGYGRRGSYESINLRGSPSQYRAAAQRSKQLISRAGCRLWLKPLPTRRVRSLPTLVPPLRYCFVRRRTWSELSGWSNRCIGRFIKLIPCG